MPSDLTLRPLLPADLPLVEAAVARSGEPTCDLAPATLRIWRGCEPASFAEVLGGVVVRLEPHHEAPYFLEPLGTSDAAAALDLCLAHTARASRVRDGLALSLPADRYEVTPIRDHFDYVYDVRGLAELRGRGFDSQRNRLRKFAREHPRHEFRPLAATDAAAALSVFDRWRADRPAPEAPGPGAGAAPVPTAADCQRLAIVHAFEEFDRLALAGGIVLDGAEPLGFLAASRAGDVTVAHFLYAATTAPGISQTLLTGCCRGVFAERAVLDLEEDLGLPGLRQTKLRWKPTRLVAKHEVRRRA